ncbi:MAG: RNA polymerase sigma factor [Mobilicoccus sp.]|nr:RNA polymerase sigma factor [Mobilicoccus sp.]
MNIDEIGTDADAFEAFYREHVEHVQRFIARRIDDPYTAADLTSDVFVAVIDSAATYTPDRGSPRGWLYGIARNLVAAERRRAARASHLGRRAAGRRQLQPDALERAAERLDAERDARALMRRIETLPERLRAVVELVAVDGLPLTEAAAVLGITPGAARVRLHRARTALALPTSIPVDLISEGGRP